MSTTVATKREPITRLDAARRQLSTAIRLYFEERDVVSIHTLAGAAHEILGVLTRHAPHVPSMPGWGKGSFLFDNPMVRPEAKRDYLDIITRDRNFFKHSGRDANESVEFDPQRTEFFLFDAVAMYRAFTGRHLYSGLLFYTWFSLKYPATVAENTSLRAQIDLLARSPNALGQAPKKSYLEWLDDPIVKQSAASFCDLD